MPIKGDFISFSYNGVHSTELGIVHVSSSDRYADALLPTIQDKTVQAPGSDGTYFFGSYYTQRPITINIAFDDVTEAQFKKIRRLFGDKKSHSLTFDEEPYKVYQAKVTGSPEYNYICFGSPRVYKGEGILTFTCYEPFARCPNNLKYLDQWVAGTGPDWYKYDNKEEWNLSAGLLSAQGNYDTFNNGKIQLYNPGDLDTNFKFKIPINATIGGIKISDGTNDLENHILMLNNNTIVPKGQDSYLLFNSCNNLIEGLNADGARTMNIYNEYIQSGSWFKIPMNQDNKTLYFIPIDYNGSTPILEYDYLYF